MKITYGQLKNMIAESVHRVLSEERYMSDEDIAAQYSDMKIVDFVLEPAKNFDGWTGRFEVEYPTADGIDFDSSVVNNFIVYDLDGNRIAWDNWMPDVATNHLESIIRKEIAKRKNGMTENKLNEIGDTSRGQYMLGRLDARNRMEREDNPDGRHGAYKGAAEDTAMKNWKDDPTLEPSFDKGYGDEHYGRDNRFKKGQYNMRAMNDRDSLQTKFVNFLQRDDRMLQLVQEYESEGKDAFNEVMDAFEEKLGYTLTDKSRKACKKAYNAWWYYNGQNIFRGMEESKVREISVNKMASYIMEGVMRKLNERKYGSRVEMGSVDISDTVFDCLYEETFNDEVMDEYVRRIEDIPMVITATIVDESEPEVGYRGYEIKDVNGVDEIKNAIISRGLPAKTTQILCDIIDEVVAGLEYDDFEKNELEKPERDEI